MGQAQPGQETRPLFTQGLKAQGRAAVVIPLEGRGRMLKWGRETRTSADRGTPRSCFRVW